MGVVVSAHDRKSGEDVAIKFLRSELAGERRWRERLAREVKLARQIHHPNVCRVFDFVQTDGHVFIVMERALRTLRDELKVDAWRERPVEQRVTDARAVTAGLAAIHQAGVIHRDVTAQNVLRLADGRLVVSDFGLAKDARDSTESVQGGTAAYMAPELAVGGSATFASDIWALGIVIHEIVFGSRPAWRANIVARGIERPARRLAAEEEGIVDLCNACTAATPTARPTPARTVAGHLESVAGFRPRKRRRRAMLALAGALVLGAAGWGAARRWHFSAAPHPSSSRDPEDPIEITAPHTDWSSFSRLSRDGSTVFRPCLIDA